MPWDLLIIAAVAGGASLLTFFSGFGLGTLLLPAMVFFLPIELAVGATAIVHLANNLLKLGLLARHVDRSTVWRFGVPGIVGAALGAWCLVHLAHTATPITLRLGSLTLGHPTPLQAVMGVVMLGFAIFELAVPTTWAFAARWLPLGGIASGFFGGLSGHQGAFRSLFLVRAGLSHEAIIATGVAIACLVDLTRLGFYGAQLAWAPLRAHVWLLVVAIAAAFAGVFVGKRLLPKITIRTLRWAVAVGLGLIGLGLLTGRLAT